MPTAMPAFAPVLRPDDEVDEAADDALVDALAVVLVTEGLLLGVMTLGKVLVDDIEVLVLLAALLLELELEASLMTK